MIMKKKIAATNARRACASVTAPEADQELYNAVITEGLPTAIYISVGNGKTGIPSFNTLAGSDMHMYDGVIPGTAEDTIGRGCAGTCNTDCEGCYAKAMTRYPLVYEHTFMNTLMARLYPEETARAIGEWIDEHNPELFRLHDSGDFASKEYTDWIMGMIADHPAVKFGAYTKRAEFFNGRLDMIPDNLSLSCSPWEGHCDPIGDLPQFIYDMNGAGNGLPHCPAVDKNGKRTGVQCKVCKHCYTARRGDRWAVYPH